MAKNMVSAPKTGPKLRFSPQNLAEMEVFLLKRWAKGRISGWRSSCQVLSERFGDCKGVVEAVVNMAKERLVTWRGVDHTWKARFKALRPRNLLKTS